MRRRAFCSCVHRDASPRSACRCGEALKLPVHHRVEVTAQHTLMITGENVIPLRSPDDLDHIPTCTTEDAFQFLDDLAIAAHRTVETLQIAIDDERQVVELLTGGDAELAQRLRLITLPVTQKCPDMAGVGVLDAAILQIPGKARLVDGGDGTDTHAHRGKLPVFLHQARMRITGQAHAALRFASKALHRLDGQTAFQKAARVNARSRVALIENQVTAALGVGPAEEMIEAHLVEARAGRITGEVTA